MIDRALIGHNQRMMVRFSVRWRPASSSFRSVRWRAISFIRKIVARIVCFAARTHVRAPAAPFARLYGRNETGDILSRFSNTSHRRNRPRRRSGVGPPAVARRSQLSAVLVFSHGVASRDARPFSAPICILGPAAAIEARRRRQLAKQEQESGMMSSLQETLMAPNLVRAFNLEDSSSRASVQTEPALLASGIRLGFMTSLMGTLRQLRDAAAAGRCDGHLRLFSPSPEESPSAPSLLPGALRFAQLFVHVSGAIYAESHQCFGRRRAH